MIKVLTKELEEPYERFLKSEKRRLIYSSLQYRQFLEEIVTGTPHYMVMENNEQIIGALPFFLSNHSQYGVVINSLPWYGSHGGLLTSSSTESDSEIVIVDLLRAFKNKLDDFPLLSATLITTPYEKAQWDVYQQILKPTIVDDRIGQITTLPRAGPEIDQRLLNVFTSKTRNLVRKSLKQGFQVNKEDTDEAWDFLYQMHYESLLAKGGQAKPKSHFEAIRKVFSPNSRHLWMASINNEPAAALLLLYYNKTVEYFVPVVNVNFRPQQPLSLLIYSAMLDAIEKGFYWWNWGGTWLSQHSLLHFKSGFGAESFPYRYFIISSPEGIKTVRQMGLKLMDEFPFFYIFPFNVLK